MYAGQSHANTIGEPAGSRRFGSYPTGGQVTFSDTIGADSRVPFIPIWEERRQTEHASLWSTSIPCFRDVYGTEHFPFWIQPVAAVNEERLRQLKSENARPEKAGSNMARCCQVSSRFYGFSTGIAQTQEAASMANPEVEKCR